MLTENDSTIDDRFDALDILRNKPLFGHIAGDLRVGGGILERRSQLVLYRGEYWRWDGRQTCRFSDCLGLELLGGDDSINHAQVERFLGIMELRFGEDCVCSVAKHGSNDLQNARWELETESKLVETEFSR